MASPCPNHTGRATELKERQAPLLLHWGIGSPFLVLLQFGVGR